MLVNTYLNDLRKFRDPVFVIIGASGASPESRVLTCAVKSLILNIDILIGR